MYPGMLTGLLVAGATIIVSWVYTRANRLYRLLILSQLCVKTHKLGLEMLFGCSTKNPGISLRLLWGACIMLNKGRKSRWVAGGKELVYCRGKKFGRVGQEECDVGQEEREEG